MRSFTPAMHGAAEHMHWMLWIDIRTSTFAVLELARTKSAGNKIYTCRWPTPQGTR